MNKNSHSTACNDVQNGAPECNSAELAEFKIEMNMFPPGKVRPVRVPTKELALAQSRHLNAVLETIYYFGQNDITPSQEYCSVSVGDVIQYDGHRYMVSGFGFRKL